MSLREWYADRELLLTGATSDVGRALLEKILRSFPHVKIYAIVRTRHGFTKDDRIKNIFLSPRFVRLRQEDPNALSRVKVLEGNLSYNGFGMSERDKELLENVSVVFHAGGPCDETVRFSKQLSRIQAIVVVRSIFERASDDRVAEAGREGGEDDGPVALVRVPLVGPALREPMPGFVDTLKGSTALIAGAGHVLGNSNLQAEIIPIDLAVNTLITVAWERATSKNVQGPVIYNAIPIGCTWSDLIKKSRQANRKFTYPTFGFRGMTSIVTLHWALVVLFEWLPSTLCDTILGLVGAKKSSSEEWKKLKESLITNERHRYTKQNRSFDDK